VDKAAAGFTGSAEGRASRIAVDPLLELTVTPLSPSPVAAVGTRRIMLRVQGNLRPAVSP